MICCENNFCLYWQDDTCLLENISLSLQGVCQSCVCVDIGGSRLDALRQKQLERLEGCLPDD